MRGDLQLCRTPAPGSGFYVRFAGDSFLHAQALTTLSALFKSAG